MTSALISPIGAAAAVIPPAVGTTGLNNTALPGALYGKAGGNHSPVANHTKKKFTDLTNDDFELGQKLRLFSDDNNPNSPNTSELFFLTIINHSYGNTIHGLSAHMSNRDMAVPLASVTKIVQTDEFSALTESQLQEKIKLIEALCTPRPAQSAAAAAAPSQPNAQQRVQRTAVAASAAQPGGCECTIM